MIATISFDWLSYLINESMWVFGPEQRNYGGMSFAIPFLLLLLLRKTKHKVHQDIYLFVVVILLGEHCSSNSKIQALISPDTNFPWYHIMTPIYFYFLSRFYTDYAFRNKWKGLRWQLPLGFALLAIWNAIYWDGFYSFPTLTAGIYSLTGILLPIFFFVYTLQRMEIERLEKSPMFWVSSGMIMYYAGNFLMWCGITILPFERDFFFSIYRINSGLTILLNMCFVVAILLNPPSMKQKT